MGINIDYGKCCWKRGSCSCGCGCSKNEKTCSGCVEACPVNAITRKDKVMIDKEKCILCGACINSCPNKAISFVE